MNDTISKIIVKAFEKDYPELMAAIKQAVEEGENRHNFERFDYYKSNRH